MLSNKNVNSKEKSINSHIQRTTTHSLNKTRILNSLNFNKGNFCMEYSKDFINLYSNNESKIFDIKQHNLKTYIYPNQSISRHSKSSMSISRLNYNNNMNNNNTSNYNANVGNNPISSVQNNNSILNSINFERDIIREREIYNKKQKQKILIVDDNQFIRTSIRNILKEIFKENNRKITIIEGCDGIETLKYIMDDQKLYNSIKCVFTDEKMEYMDGSKSIQIIREMEKLDKIKRVHIVSVTSYDDENNKHFIYNSGVDHIIQKPCSKSTLINILLKLKII